MNLISTFITILSRRSWWLLSIFFLVSGQAFAGKKIPMFELDLGEVITLESKSLSQSREIFIRLPTGYSKNENPYPVIYLLDTNNEVMTYLDNVYFHSIVTIERLMLRGAIPPSIVVGVSTPGEQWYRNVVGKPDEFGEFLVNELVPYINQNYMTSDNSIIFGQSYTGVFVLNTYAKHPDIFDSYIAADPILTGAELEKAVENFKQAGTVKGAKLKIIKSDSEFEEFTIFKDQVSKLNRSDFDLELHHIESESHATVYYPALNSELRRHFADYRTIYLEEALNKTYGYQQILKFHADSAKKYGEDIDHHKVQESVYDVFSGYLSARRFDEAFRLWPHWDSNHKAYNVNRVVDNFLRKGEDTAAITLLNKLIQKLPEFPSGYYRLAKIYDKAEEHSKAKRQYQRINNLLNKLNKPEHQGVWNSFAYQLMSENKLDYAIRVLKKVANVYPESINAFDSLGEAYELAEQYDLAIKAFEYAVLLAKKSNSEQISVFESNLRRVKEKRSS